MDNIMTEMLKPLECKNKTKKLDKNELFFVLNNEILPRYEHTVTFTVSIIIIILYHKCLRKYHSTNSS